LPLRRIETGRTQLVQDITASVETDEEVFNRVPVFERERPRRYVPLREEPELFLKFVRLAEQEMDRNTWLNWVNRYGTLGLGRVEPYKPHAQGGPGETYARFVEESKAGNTALRLFEAATAPYGPNTEAISSRVPDRYRAYVMANADRARNWALKEAAVLCQYRLKTECYPQLYGTTDTFERSWDFRSLLGAMWLQFFWLLTATGGVRRCQAPGCTNVISFEGPVAPPDRTVHNDRSHGYRKRRDAKTCSDACRQRLHYHNKKRGAS
jgi:hypothetical protein